MFTKTYEVLNSNMLVPHSPAAVPAPVATTPKPTDMHELLELLLVLHPSHPDVGISKQAWYYHGSTTLATAFATWLLSPRWNLSAPIRMCTSRGTLQHWSTSGCDCGILRERHVTRPYPSWQKSHRRNESMNADSDGADCYPQGIMRTSSGA